MHRKKVQPVKEESKEEVKTEENMTPAQPEANAQVYWKY